MEIIDALASRVGTGQEANVVVAERCLAEPALLGDIVAGLQDRNARLVGDCAEVLTMVAEQRPELVAPHAKTLLGLLGHKNGRVRWESAHALALVSRLAPRVVAGALERLAELARHDKSVIVRDYVIDAIAGYGATGPKAAAAAFSLLRELASAWETKHAARILKGLADVAAAAPKLGGEIRTLAASFEGHARPGVRKAAKSLLKATAAKGR